MPSNIVTGDDIQRVQYISIQLFHNVHHRLFGSSNETPHLETFIQKAAVAEWKCQASAIGAALKAFFPRIHK